MFDLIEGWLFNLGITCNLSKLEENNLFQDGCILASIFHKYCLLNDSFNRNIQPTTTKDECIKNLRRLNPIFAMLKIKFNESILNEIVENNTGTIINLLYELYICLENKQHLYFITKQTFEKVYQNTTRNFNSFPVKEIELENIPSEKMCLEQPIIDNADVIEWYKSKYEKVKRKLEAKGDHLKKPELNKEVTINIKETCPTSNRPIKKSESVEALPELDSFFNDNSDKNLLDYESFMARYKLKQNSKEIRECFDYTIQYGLLQSTWRKIEERENKIFNSVFSDILLKQSHYEKQLLSKLIQTRKETCIQNQHNIFAKDSIMREHEDIINIDFESRNNIEMIEKMCTEYEQNRVIELHKNLYKEKKEFVRNDIRNICQEVVGDLLELVFSAIEYKAVNGIDVFECMWNNWMQLFIKSQPIHVHKFNNFKDYEEAIYSVKESFEPKIKYDVAEYLTAQGKWYYSDICLENEAGLNEKNLAFIVYRLLTVKYPLPPSPSAADLPPFRIAGVLLNFHNKDAVEKLKILLSVPNIHLFDTDLAVNFCIKQFLVETASILEEKQNSMNESLGAIELEECKRKNNKKKTNKLCEKQEIVLNDKEGKLANLINKETQTVNKCEDEKKTERTSLGLLGEEVTKILKEGDKIPDLTLAKVITEYLKSLEDYDGWILLNYPATIEQAFHLELALTGKKIPIENFVSEENNSFHTEESDHCGDKRISRLLKSPINETDSQSFVSYFTSILRVQEEVRENDNISNINQESYFLESYELQENQSHDLFKDFYCNLNIFKEFDNKFSNLSNLKKLARVILKENDTEAKASMDLFGEEVLNKLTKDGKIYKTRNKSVSASVEIKKNLKLESKAQSGVFFKKLSVKNEENEYDLNNFDRDTDPDEAQNRQKAGNLENIDYFPDLTRDQNVQSRNFASLPLNNEFAVLLATMWEDVESYYISNLQEILFENSFLNVRLQLYKIYVQTEMKNIANKQDLKQNLINLFQEYYNNINNELRALPEMKNMLHFKVMELQQNLSGIMEERKNELEAKRQEIITDNWLLYEMCMLINNYTYFVNLEVERSVKTLQLVNDYYMNMLERIPLTVAIPQEKQYIPRISVEEFKNTGERWSNKPEHSEIQNYTDTDCNSCIIKSFINCYEEETPIDIFNSIISEKISNVKSNFNSFLKIYLEQNKTESSYAANANKKESKVKSNINKGKTSIKPKKDMEKHKLTTKSNQIQQDTAEKISERELLIDEWKTTINVESERLNHRLNLIHRKAKENISDFYCCLKSVFCNLHASIFSTCNIETANNNLICDYLKTAIEEESPLNHPLFIEQDRFFVFIEDNETRSVDHTILELTEDFHDCIFTMKQLGFLVEIFKISGPMGVIRKQPLCYILQDLMARDTCHNHPHLPKIWEFLNEVQLRNVIDSMFGLEFGVDWRDFIIYNLDIPYPDVKDILYLRNQFLSYDSEETELISLEDYESITLWFEKDLPINPKQGLRFALVKKLLSEIFKVNIQYINYTALLLYFCKDVTPEYGFKKALSLSLGKNVVVSKSELNMIIEHEAEINQIVSSVIEDIISGIVETKEAVYEEVYELINSLFDNSLLSEEVSEENLRNSIFSSFKTGSLKSLSMDYSILNPPPSLIDEEKTSQIKQQKIHISRENSWATRIPVSLVLSVLNAALFYQDRKFALKDQYLNCIEDSADSDGMIEAYDLVNIDCVQKLFTLTNKFKISIPCNILRHVLNKNKSHDDSQTRDELCNLHSW